MPCRGVEHVITHGMVRYPGEVSDYGDQPHILHYGIDFTLSRDYNWNKMSYQKLDLFQCKGRYFGPPPAGNGGKRHEAMRFVVNTLNRAFCEFYHTRCPGTPAALRACPPTTRPPQLPCAPGAEGTDACCRDQQPTCWQWAIDEQCEENKGFMDSTCKLSCGVCTPPTPALGAPATDAAHRTLAKLAKLEERLQPFLSEADSSAAASSFSALKADRPPSLGDTASLGSAGAAAIAAASLPHAATEPLKAAASPPPAEALAAAEELGEHANEHANEHADEHADEHANEHANEHVGHAGTAGADASARAALGHVVPSTADGSQHADGAHADGAHADGAHAAAHEEAAGHAHAALPVWQDLTDPALRGHAPAAVAPARSIAHTAAGASGVHLPAGAHLPAVVHPTVMGAHAVAGMHAPGSAHRDNGAAIADEFRRVASQHAKSYAPGQVPQWLERQAGATAGATTDASTGAHAPVASAPVRRFGGEMLGAHGAAVAGKASRAYRRDEAHTGTDEHEEGHRALLLGLVCLWLTVLALALARCFRVWPCHGGKKRARRAGEPRSDLLHRF